MAIFISFKSAFNLKTVSKSSFTDIIILSCFINADSCSLPMQQSILKFSFNYGALFYSWAFFFAVAIHLSIFEWANNLTLKSINCNPSSASWSETVFVSIYPKMTIKEISNDPIWIWLDVRKLLLENRDLIRVSIVMKLNLSGVLNDKLENSQLIYLKINRIIWIRVFFKTQNSECIVDTDLFGWIQINHLFERIFKLFERIFTRNFV